MTLGVCYARGRSVMDDPWSVYARGRPVMDDPWSVLCEGKTNDG